jgi:glycosyltransferase involved in cell wall biosynthesis
MPNHLLRVIHSLDPAAGGPVAVVRQTARLMAQHGVRTTAVSLDAADAPFLQAEPQEGLVCLGIGPGRGTYGYVRGAAARLAQLAAQADAVIIDGIWQYHSLASWRAIKQLGSAAPPYWVYPHGMLDPWFRYTYPRKHLKKWLYWPWSDYRVLRDAQAVLYTLEQERRLARQSFWLYDARERVVPFGIEQPQGDPESQRQSFLEAFPALAGRRLLLSLARLHEKKGLDLLIQAFAVEAAQHPDLDLMIAGSEDGLGQSLQLLTDRLGLADRVHFPGLLRGDLKWGALHACELFCLPSHQENFGLAVVEAMACRRPVLISTGINLAEEVRQAGAGLVQADTLSETSAALAQWLRFTPPERAAMGERGQELFARRFRLDSGVAELLEVLSFTGS